MNLYTDNGTLNPRMPVNVRRELTKHFLPLNTRLLVYADLYSHCEHDDLGKFIVRSGYKPVFYETTIQEPQQLTVYQVRGLPTVFISLSADRVRAQKARFPLVPVLNLSADTDLNIFKEQRSRIIQEPGFYDITTEELQRIKTLSEYP